MNNGKVRAKQHILGDKAIRFIRDTMLPNEWVVREMNPDYGIDLDIELFDYENGKCVTLGEHLLLQVKGVENAAHGDVTLGGERLSVVKDSLETEELNLVERMGSAFPVLLVIVDLGAELAYQICLNDYIRKVLPLQNPNYKKQKTVTIYIPAQNTLSKDDLNPIKWYAKRIKLYSMFYEMVADIHDFSYMSMEETVERCKRLLEHYRTFDALQAAEYWTAIADIRNSIEIMVENDGILPEAVVFLQRITGTSEKWEEASIFQGLDEKPINAYLYAQYHSAEILTNKITASSGAFEEVCREWFMPGLPLGVKG